MSTEWEACDKSINNAQNQQNAALIFVYSFLLTIKNEVNDWLIL